MKRPRSARPAFWRPVTQGARVLVVVVCGVAVTPLASAAAVDSNPKAEAKVQVSKAQLHYKLGRFEEALAAYTKAYELFNAPALLFNIGQCHKNLKNYDRAIFFFEGYLREERNPEKRALAEQLIESSRADLLRQRNEPPPVPAAPPPVTPPPPAPEPAPVDAGVPVPPPQAAPLPEAFPLPPPPLVDTTPPPQPITQTWWFWTAIGAGVLAVAGGTVAYYATGTTTMVQPSGTLGTLDRR